MGRSYPNLTRMLPTSSWLTKRAVDRRRCVGPFFDYKNPQVTPRSTTQVASRNKMTRMALTVLSLCVQQEQSTASVTDKTMMPGPW